MSSNTNSASNETSSTYKFLLALSTAAAVFFCWLYVTKPVAAIQAKAESPATTEPAVATEEPPAAEPEPVSSFVALAGSALPGDPQARPTEVAATATGATIPLAQSPATAGKIGWEETNDRIQHALTAQTGESSERVILEVPVIYQTRGLRFAPEQAQEAARILRALKIYQSQIKKLHQDGKNIQVAWDTLLLNSQPISSLRADSPSLPSSENTAVLPQNSSATIKISN